MNNDQMNNDQLQEDLTEVLRVRRDKLTRYKKWEEILLRLVDTIELVTLQK